MGSGERALRRAVCLALGALLALPAGCGGDGHHHERRPRASRGELSAPHPCRHIRGARCATLSVPLDHFRSTPGRLRLRVAMSGNVHAPRGVAVFLTGGPGQPGTPFLPRIRQRLGRAFRGYLLVMLDQRGTGAGALDCPALQRAVGASDLTVPPPGAVADCARRLGDRRRFYTTRDTVEDLDALRGALAANRLTLDGVSYGSFVAERYALAHPRRVGRLVLDSVVPQEGIDPFQLDTIHAVPRVLRAACASLHCPSDPARDLVAVVRRYRNGPALLDMLVLMSVVDPSYRAVVPALRAARAGHAAALDRLMAGVRRGSRVPSSILSQGLHASTLCEDFRQPWGGPDTPLPQRADAIRAAAAQLGPADVWPFDRATATGNGELLTCQSWPPVALHLPPSDQMSASLPAVPALLLAGDRDLSTPLAWAQGEARHARGGRLDVVRGAGHSVQLRSRGAAAPDLVARFLHAG